MQAFITPETELIASCPNCQRKLSIHKNMDDRIVCAYCFTAYDYSEGKFVFAFQSFEGDAIGEKYLRYSEPDYIREKE